ncbi:MAG TPA: glutathione S-transferase family protein [Polyangia bacterium]|nr:glutathione S-transferase family protein [Polyangia bacterium]
MALRFYSWPKSSGTRVHWALEELSVPYEVVTLDRAKGDHRAPGYLAINPGGKVPALVDGEQPYFESLAILLHLAETYGPRAGLWPGVGISARAEALCWSVWGMTEVHPYMMQYLYHGLDTPVSYAPDQRSKATASYNHGQLLRLLDALNERLATRDHILGAFSLADIPAASTLLFGAGLGLKLEGRANVERWLERCRARPAFTRVTA